jgi:hypothetical protein
MIWALYGWILPKCGTLNVALSMILALLLVGQGVGADFFAQ